MALEEAILGFFGAGVAALGAPGCPLPVPGMPAPGGGLIDQLVAGGLGHRSRELLNALARDMRDLIASGRYPIGDLERHMRELPRLIAQHPPSPAVIGAAAAYYAEHPPGKPNGREPPAIGLARSIASAAEAAGTMQGFGLDAPLTMRLIEVLFTRVLADPAFLDGVKPAVAALQPVAVPRTPYPDETTAEPEGVAVETLPDDLARMLRRLNQDTGVPLSALAALLSAQARRGAEPARIEGSLADKAAQFRDLVQRIGRAPAGDPVLQRLRSEAVSALDEGKLDEADSLLSGAEARLLTSGAGDARARSIAELRCQRAALEELRLDYHRSARHFEAAVQSLPAEDKEGRWSCMLRQGAALQSETEEFGDEDALAEAIVIFARALEEAPRETAPDRFSITHNHLGNALLALGDREGSAEKLALAEKSYRLAIAERRRGSAPNEWALLSSNLGTALLKLGEIEGEPQRFRDAALAFGSALEVFTRERTPADWALTQMNLATALSRLSAHEDDIRPLEGAANAYRAALEGYSAEERPAERARIENSLGNVLSELGERTGETRWLELAADAYRSALHVWTREQSGLQWALATANLGNSLWALGEMTSDPGLLSEAADLILSALEVFRERGEAQYEQTALDNLRALRETLGRLGARAAVGR